MIRTFTLIAALALPAVASAYETHPTPWNDPQKTFRVLTGMPSAFKAVMDDVEAQYAQNPTTHQATVIWDDDNGWGLPNWENEVGWISNMSSVCPSAGGGCAKLWINFDPFDAYIVEADIVFDKFTDWTTGTDKTVHMSYGGTQRPFLCTALHEMGHAMGLQHENDRYNIMGTDWNFISTNDNAFRCEIGADAMAGLAAMYGVQYPRTDFGLSHFHYTGAGGNGNAYSQHGRNGLYTIKNLAGINVYWPLNKQSDGAWLVPAGATVYLEVTAQNASTSSKVMPLSIMLSENGLISSLDYNLGNAFYSMAAGQVTTLMVPIVVPTTYIDPDPWYIGAIADNAGSYSEDLESNNKVYIDRIRVFKVF